MQIGMVSLIAVHETDADTHIDILGLVPAYSFNGGFTHFQRWSRYQLPRRRQIVLSRIHRRRYPQ